MAAYIELMPREDQRIYLATQTADEGRHVAFFERFTREVAGAGADVGGASVEAWQASPSLRYLFAEAPQRLLARAKAVPDDPLALVSAIMLTHIILEGSLAMSTMRVVLQTFTREGGFVGFLTGMKGLLRDECRHFTFGLRFVRDALRGTPALSAPLAAFVQSLTPHLERVLTVPPERRAALTGLGLDPHERRTLTYHSLRCHLQRIGLPLELPDCAEAQQAG
jgi:ribonucleoside-diphosphate reductase beta chain